MILGFRRKDGVVRVGERFAFGKKLVVTLALVSILLVSGLGYLYYSGTKKAERNLVGVISVEGPIISSQTAVRVTEAINQAIFNTSVKAVVLRIDSPGGYAHLIEQIYLDALELKGEKPVVSSVASALSGGYYIAVAADFIFAHPTSMVGNVGVIGTGPATLIPSEMIMETGPYKATGFSKLLFPFNLSHALDSFVSAVEGGRENRLSLSSKELRRGMIYLGTEAMTAGLVDEVGSLQKAAEHAAEEAGLTEYEVVEIRPAAFVKGLSTYRSNETEVEWRDITAEILNTLNPPPAVYYLYLPSTAYMQSLATLDQTTEDLGVNETTTVTGRGDVVVDLSHGNKISSWELDILMAELAKRDMILAFATTWEEVNSSLVSASGLIVAAPTESYSAKEREMIKEFVEDDRLLILFSDSAAEYLEIPSLLGPINSIAKQFGLTFAKGYLYNEEEHYGLYRNIYVRQFANTSVTGNLDTIVLFTSTHIRSMGKEAAWTSSDTYSSTAERQDSYAPIALVELNGTVAAFGDFTFLMEPYCYVEDNYELILNLVSVLAEIEVEYVEKPEEVEYNITKPELPVGTVKIFTEQIDDEEHQVTWIRVSENETRVERPDRTTHYHYDEAGSLLGYESNGMEVSYDEPLPETPYPLIKGKEWAYASNYTVMLEEEALRGRLAGNEAVVDFKKVEAGDGERYLCAKVKLQERDELRKGESNITAVTTGHSWISKEAGLVKGEMVTRYYVDGVLVDEETRSLLLTSIQKGEG